MRNLVLAGRSGAVIAAVLLLATGIAARERPDGAIGPIPGEPSNGAVPMLAATAALCVAIVATTAGAISLARSPRLDRNLPSVPGWDRPEIRIRTAYLAIAALALVISVAVLPMLQREIAPEPKQAPPPAEATTEPAPPNSSNSPDVPTDSAPATFGILVVATISALILLATWRSIRRQRGDDDREPEQSSPGTSTPEPLVRATELALADLTEPNRPPREAIIACFASMENALAGTEFEPRAADTAMEVIDRAVGRGHLPAEPAATLGELFTEARFSPHEMTERHQESAARALHDVLEGWGR